MNVQSAPILNRILSSPAVFPAIFASFYRLNIEMKWATLIFHVDHTHGNSPLNWNSQAKCHRNCKIFLPYDYDKHNCQINCKATNMNIETFLYRFEDQHLRTDVERRFIRSVVRTNYASNSLSITSSISNCRVSAGLRLYQAKTEQFRLW